MKLSQEWQKQGVLLTAEICRPQKGSSIHIEREPGWDKISARLYYITGLLDFSVLITIVLAVQFKTLAFGFQLMLNACQMI